MNKVNEKNGKTYHERIRIYFEKVVIRDEKKVRITDVIVSEIDDLSSQYFLKKYCVYKKKITLTI